MFNEDLTVFFQDADFAETAEIILADSEVLTIQVLFDSPTSAVGLYESNVEVAGNFLTCKTSEIDKVKKRNQVKIKNQLFTIELIRHDGTGLSYLYLKN